MRNFIFLFALFLVGCGAYSANVPSIRPYKLDIQQGNAVTPKMMLQLRPGMNKTQVRFIMGTPLLTDSFHSVRWDYFYQMQKDGKVFEQRRIILFFEDDKLKTVKGDVIPAGNDGRMTVEPVTEVKSDMFERKGKEKGLLDRLKLWGDDDKSTPAETKPAVQPDNQSEPAKVAPVALPVPAQEEPKAVPATGVKPAVKEKRLLDKLKFWESDEPVAPKAAPAVKPEAKPEPKAEPTVEPAPVAAPEPEVKPEPIPEAEPAAVEAAPEAVVPPAETQPEPVVVPESKPEPVIHPEAPNPVPEAAPSAKPESKTEVKAQPKPAPVATVKPEPVEVKPAPKAPVPAERPVPQPGKDLPPEDAPDFFEKMLEKIGF